MRIKIGMIHLDIYFKPKQMSTDELLIQWVDALLETTNEKDEVLMNAFDSGWILSVWGGSPLSPREATIFTPLQNIVKQEAKKHAPPDVDLLDKPLMDYEAVVRKFLLNQKYITTNLTQKGEIWKLTSTGLLAKELGGYKKYKKYRRREINRLEHQSLINWFLIIATFLAAIMPWVVEWYKKHF